MATTERFRIAGVTEYWYQTDRTGGEVTGFVYRPAVLIEYTLNFRSLRAGLNHSEERNYTAWLPELDLAIDWDAPAVLFSDGSLLRNVPEDDIPYVKARYQTTSEQMREYETALVDKLIRYERLRVWFSPSFGLFSAPGDELESFKGMIADEALRRVEPELKRLHAKFGLQIEQVREAQLRKGFSGEEVNADRLISRNLRLFESENRLTSMFLTLAGSVFGASEYRHAEDIKPSEAELREDLDRIEKEAYEAIQSLHSEYFNLANEYDTFEIGLQPDNIQVRRRALLWVPIAGCDLHEAGLK